MPQIDLSILNRVPHLDLDAELIIEPLAPLSMVSELPGSFYKTQKSPSERMLCGLIENVIGWQIDIKDRKLILGDMKAIWQKQKLSFDIPLSGSTYIPLLLGYFKISGDVKIDLGKVCFYDDLWKRSYRRTDAVVHPKGTEDIDYRLIPEKRKLKRDSEHPDMVDDKALEEFFKNHIGGFPTYYSTLSSREYLDMKGSYIIPLLIDPELFNMLEDNLPSNNIGYLGNSEGWININLRKI